MAAFISAGITPRVKVKSSASTSFAGTVARERNGDKSTDVPGPYVCTGS